MHVLKISIELNHISSLWRSRLLEWTVRAIKQADRQLVHSVIRNLPKTHQHKHSEVQFRHRLAELIPAESQQLPHITPSDHVPDNKP